MTSAGHLSLYPWLLKLTELHRVYFLLLYFVPLDATCFGEKKKKRWPDRLTDIKEGLEEVPLCYNFLSLLCSNHENMSKISFFKDIRDKYMGEMG